MTVMRWLSQTGTRTVSLSVLSALTIAICDRASKTAPRSPALAFGCSYSVLKERRRAHFQKGRRCQRYTGIGTKRNSRYSPQIRSRRVVDLRADEQLLEALPPEGMLTLPPVSGLSNQVAALDCWTRPPRVTLAGRD